MAPEITVGPAAAPALLPLFSLEEEGTRPTLDSNDRLIPETKPPVKVSSNPKGFPRANICCPTLRAEAVSALSIGRSFAKKSSPPVAAAAPPSKSRTATSCDLSTPTTAASRALLLPSVV